MKVCNCSYSVNFIIDGQFLCFSSNELVYQGQFLTTNSKNAEEVRNLTQAWVLKKPMIKIANRSFQIDPFCSVTLITIGDSYCDAVESTAVINGLDSTKIPVSAGVGVILIVILLTVVIVITSTMAGCYIIKRKKINPFRHSALRYVLPLA